MKTVLVLMVGLLALAGAGNAASLCTSAFLDTMTGGAFNCYEPGVGGFPDVVFSNFTYTGPGLTSSILAAPIPGLLRGLDQASFTFLNLNFLPNTTWASSAAFTITFNATICGAFGTAGECTDTGLGGLNTYTFEGATMQQNLFNAGNAPTVNSFAGLNLNITSGTEMDADFGANPSGVTTGTYKIQHYAKTGNATINTFGAYVYVQDTVPEPVTMLLAGGGLLALGLVARKRRKA
jgi:hypothetical protein